MEKCSKCSEVLTDDNWQPSLKKRNRRLCRTCSSESATTWANKNKEKVREYQRKYQTEYQENHVVCNLWYHARRRALAKGIPFSISVTDIVMPEKCPVFGVQFEVRTPFAPSLDRIEPRLGYIPGNIAVISKRANTIKSDGSLAELKLIVAWLEGRIDIPSPPTV